MSEICKACKGAKGAYDERRVWRACKKCKGTGKKKSV